MIATVGYILWCSALISIDESLQLLFILIILCWIVVLYHCYKYTQIFKRVLRIFGMLKYLCIIVLSILS